MVICTYFSVKVFGLKMDVTSYLINNDMNAPNGQFWYSKSGPFIDFQSLAHNTILLQPKQCKINEHLCET